MALTLGQRSHSPWIVGGGNPVQSLNSAICPGKLGAIYFLPFREQVSQLCCALPGARTDLAAGLGVCLTGVVI